MMWAIPHMYTNNILHYAYNLYVLLQYGDIKTSVPDEWHAFAAIQLKIKNIPILILDNTWTIIRSRNFSLRPGAPIKILFKL